MNITNEIDRYLLGINFCAFSPIPIDSGQAITNRRQALVDLVTDKKVLHIGCCDHVPLIKGKLLQNIWLHKLISESSSQTLGIDIDADSVEYVRYKIGYDNVIYGDIMSKAIIYEIASQKWDYAVLAETLEHVDNPVAFLSSMLKYKNSIKNIVVTAPNAFAYRNFLNAKNNIEKINTDHRYWFTPYTLAKVMTRSGIKVKEIKYADRHVSKKFVYRLLRKMKMDGYLSTMPAAMSNTLVAIGELGFPPESERPVLG